MLLAILYCRQQGRPFAIATRYSPVFYRDGWRDFFEPFCPEIDSWLLHVLDGRPATPLVSPRAVVKRGLRVLARALRPVCYPHIELMSGCWDAIRALLAKQPAVLRPMLAPIAREVWRHNPETSACIRSMRGSLALPGPFVALHIRRGDKDTEVPHTGESAYIDRLERITGISDVYVATDDYTCVETIRRLRPSWRVFSLCPPEARGYDHPEFRRQPAAERRRRTQQLLAEVEIMRGAEVFVGTFSSGIGTFLGLIREGQTYGVDSEHWMFEGGL
jgi:hypothetical protein